jgi:cytoskeleton protein RodZ
MGLPVLHERRTKLVESRDMMSTVTGGVTEPAAAARAGADLREARERLGLSVHDIAETLRIRVSHLEALEAGNIASLPGNAYALAFVRTYATTLGLDAEEMVRRFRTEVSEVSRRPELVFPIPMPEPGLPAGAVLLLGLVLAIGAYAGWYRLSGEGRLPAETVAAIPERLAPLAQQALPPDTPPVAITPGAAPVGVAAADPNAPGAGAAGAGAPSGGPALVVAPAAIAEASGTAAPQPVPMPAPPVVAISPSSAAAAQLPAAPDTPAATDGSAAPASAAPAPVASEAAAAPAPAPDANRLVLRATKTAWVEVREPSGSVLLNRVLKPGETWAVPPRSDLLLTTGNAWGMEIVVDGATTVGLGPGKAVRHNIPLDPDQLKAGKVAEAAPSSPSHQ